MKNRIQLIIAFIAAVLWPLIGRASYFDLIPNSKTDLEVVTYDARYPYWTQGIYIATYPLDCRSVEGWAGQYYGGVQLNSSAKVTNLLWSTWQMHGKGAPTTGIDFVHAGPRMGWHRSTWEGSSGGVSGQWPVDEFNVNQWYRFVHRVWRPTDKTPHTGYAGVWIKNLQTGQWYHTATFKFPAELTGFSNMGGFMEWFGGNNTPPKAAVEFRNCYSFNEGKWISQTNFTANNGHGGDSVTLNAGENGVGVVMETTSTPKDPITKKRATLPEQHLNFAMHQPDQPGVFDEPKIGTPSAEYLGKQVAIRWSVDSKSSPQLGYDVDVFDDATRVGSASWNDPEARQCVVSLSAVPAGKVSVAMKLRDIFNQTSPEVRFAATRGVALPPAEISGLVPGISYHYYETAKPESWVELPDFAALKAQRTGVTAVPDITARLHRSGYAFSFDGYLSVHTDGLYTFNLVAGSGARLAIDGKVVIDADGDRSIDRYPGTVALKAGAHPVQILFYYGKGLGHQADDFLQMTWSGPGFANTAVPASAFSHASASQEPTLAADAKLVDAIHLQLSSQLTGGRAKRVEYYAVNDHFDYFSQQGAQFESYCLDGTDHPDQTVSALIWGGETKTIFARAILEDGRTIDSPPVVVHDTAPAPTPDANGMTLTELEHHLYPMNHAVENGVVTLVGESTGLLTRTHKGDVTLIAHLAGITSDRAIADGTRPEGAGNWFSGIILRDNLKPRPGEPLGGRDIPYIAVFGSADGAIRHDDSTMINGAGNQPSGDVGSDSKWFKLTRKGQQLCAYISKDGQTWKKVADITQPKMQDEIEIGFVHYSIPTATPIIHWARFDHVSITDHAEEG